MRQNPEYILCDVAGNHILITAGKAAIDLNGMVTLNDMGVEIWKKLERDVTYEELVTVILDEYGVSEEAARADLNRFVEILRNTNGIID